MSIRKLVEQLPSRIQTATNKKLFASTVDQVFQPGSLQQLTGYIGQKPSYYNATTDLYVPEPDVTRQEHQLEPAMLSRDGNGNVTNLLTYDDFINYLALNHGNVTDHNRLFSDKVYSWAPPVDIDKLSNPSSYFWFGDDPSLIPVLTLTSPVATALGNGATMVFAVPAMAAGLTSAQDNVVVLVNGIATTRWTRTSDLLITLAFAPAVGASVKVYRYGDLSLFLTGATGFDPTPFTTQGVTAVTSGMVVTLIDAMATNTNTRTFWIEGVGAGIDLVPFNSVYNPLAQDPIYVTIDRRSADGNPWTKTNYWLHGDAFSWAGTLYPTRAATRPIIEFIPNIELQNYGINRVTDITCKVSGNPLFGQGIFARSLNEYISNYDTLPYDEEGWNTSAILEIPISSINEGLSGSIYVDTQHVLQVGDTLLVVDNINTSVNNCVLTIDSVFDPTTNTNILAAVISLVPQAGDIVSMPVQGLIAWDMTSEEFDTTPFEYNGSPIEYYFDGIEWHLAQQAVLGGDPMFNVYDAFGNFLGSNRIFGYQVGTGTNDSVLNRPLSYDNEGDILFSNDLVNVVEPGVTGFQYFRVVGGSPEYRNGWLMGAALTQQTEDSNGIWTTPLNLTANPDNDEVVSITKPQWFPHFSQIISSQDGFLGSYYAQNNFDDTPRDLSMGQSIVQNQSPLLKAMLLASNTSIDYFNAARFVETEYTRFRQKFFAQITTVYQSGQRTLSQSPSTWVPVILRNLAMTKTSAFPFALSTVGGGNFFIPPTPASIGMLPSVFPEIIVDESYSSPVTLIVGHDGSRTPATNDYRDAVMLALEQQIYTNILPMFQTGAMLSFDMFNYVAGRYRAYVSSKNYSPTDMAMLLSPSLIRWSQINNFNFAVNAGYIATNPFTWNFRGVNDRYGDPLPVGNWRGIYQYYFDTDSPDVTPWEMLGFATKPSWFDAQYGVAPYTSGNTVLWNDLRDGRIARGPRAGIDARFARPDLYNVLPVDAYGNLLDPISCGIVPRAPTTKVATAAWQAGDRGPVENLWTNSPAYAFAITLVAGLMRPAEWIEANWDTTNTVVLNGQRINTLTSNRPASADLYVHGETVNNVVIARPGIQQWISDMLVSQGQAPSILGTAVRGLGVQLAHRMAGFTQVSNITTRCDNFGVIPSENVEVVLYQPAPFKISYYSAIIIEWTGAGWSVVGYDDMNNVFKTIPGDTTSLKTTISTGQNPIVYDWYPGVYYPVGRIVNYKGTYYVCVIANTSGNTFVSSYWSVDSSLVFYPSVQVYSEGLDEVVDVTYGTVFTSLEDVAMFIRDYFRWMENDGWVFETIDPNTGSVEDWNFAILQFLTWAQLSYVPGNFIALSPGASKVKFESSQGQSYSMSAVVGGSYGLVNRQARPIPINTAFVTRVEGTTEISVQSQDLSGARIRLGMIEHVLLFSNTTIFNDLIYQPLFNLRQPRIYFIGGRARDWTGRREAPGYVIVDNALMASFDKAENDVRYAFDIERSDDANIRSYARHNIGYQTRSYLTNLLVDETEQFEFFMGMIQEKGSSAGFTKLARSNLIEQQGDISFLEEWAFQLGNYGSLAKTSTFSFNLRRSDIRSNPQFIQFGVNQVEDASISLNGTDSRWVEEPQSALVFPYITQSNGQPGFGVGPYGVAGWDVSKGYTAVAAAALPNAGYVRIDETDLACRSYSAITQLYINVQTTANLIVAGTRIWVYERPDGSFDLLTAFYAPDSTQTLTSIQTIAEDSTIPLGYARINFSEPHNLGAIDVGLYCILAGMTGTSPDMEGVTQIVRVDSTTSIIVYSQATSGYDYTQAGILGYLTPPFYILRSMRFANQAAAMAFWTRFSPTAGQMIYVDNSGNGNNTWAVYQWNVAQASWVIYREQPPKLDTTRLARSIIYDLKTQITDDQIIANPLLLEGITVLDPNAGLLPGEAMRDLSYILDYDPANYDLTTANVWGPAQVGQLWWNLGTCWFLTTETDVLYKYDDSARDQAELTYRKNNWGKAAPYSSFDVYEWSRSLDPPTSYSGIGTVFNASNAHFVSRTEYDPSVGALVVAYYYWVIGQSVVPMIHGRNISALAVATILANPVSNDVAWIAPIAPNAMLLANFEQYINDQTSVLEVSTADNTIGGITHSEWQIMTAYDGQSTAPEPLWKTLRSSLVGFTDEGQPLPSTSLAAVNRVGYGPGKTMIARERSGMLSARRTFVEAVNAILALTPMAFNNPGITTTLTVETPQFQNLYWTSPDVRTSRVSPPLNSYTDVVIGIEQRDALLRTERYMVIRGFELWDIPKWDTEPWDADFAHVAIQNISGRILVYNPEGALPSWSVWEIAGSNALTSNNPNDWLVLAQNFTITVPTYAAMVAGTYVNLTRILVQSDETAFGFWTVWIYNPSSRYANANGFILLNAQTYRTQDFWSLVDWYASGYSSSSPPNITYANAAARDQAEGPSPTNVFVLLDDGGNGLWAWTAYDGTNWNIVAREDGTVALSAAFYDPTRVVYGFSNPLITDNISIRDGSLELQTLIDILRTQILTNGELNQIWFSMVHFMHSQQDIINWVFKTSFMSLADFNESLTQTGIAAIDNTQNLLDYIEEVRPYRVKTRDFTRTVSPPIDVANVHVTDFDSPPYYDSNLGSYRRLDPTNVNDLKIFQTQTPWSEWYANYLHTGTDPTQPNYNPIRKFEITIRFDRIDPTGTPLQPITTTTVTELTAVPGLESALNRMLAFYAPTEGMVGPQNDLLGVGDKRELILGNDATATDLHLTDSAQGETSQINAAGSNNPAFLPGHPEEFLPVFCNDAVSIVVHQDRTAGASPQFERYTVRTSPTVTVNFGIVPASLDSVFVFFDGVRAPASAYTVSFFDHVATITLPSPAPSTTMVHALGVGGSTLINQERFFDGDGSTTTFSFASEPEGYVEVTINGVVANPSSYEVSGKSVVLESPPATGVDIMLCDRAYGPNGSSETTTVAVRETLAYNTNQAWTLSTPTVIPSGPQHVGTIVEVNGLRLNHPFTRYGSFGSIVRSMPFTTVSNIDNVSAWINDEPYTGIIAQVPSATTPVIPQGYVGKYDTALWDDDMLWDVEGDIVLYLEDYIIANNPTLNGKVVVTSSENADFNVNNGVLTINKTLISSDLIEATTYDNAELLCIQTSTFHGAAEGLYHLPETAGDTYLVTVDGVAQTLGKDYVVRLMEVGFDQSGEDTDAYEHPAPTREMVMTTGLPYSSFINVMGFTGRLAAEEFTWHSSSKLPAVQMMGDPDLAQVKIPGYKDAWDSSDWDINPWDVGIPDTWALENVTAESSQGTRQLWLMNGTWDFDKWSRANCGELLAPLQATDTSFTMRLNPFDLAEELVNLGTFVPVDRVTPGVVWIHGERIEYSSYTLTNGVATISGLRRGTHGTSVGSEQRVVSTYQGNGSSTSFLLVDADVNFSNLAQSIEVSLWQSGQTTPMSLGAHYTITGSPGGVTVDFLTPPGANKIVILTQSTGVFHPIGAIVYPSSVETEGTGPFEQTKHLIAA